MLNFLPKLKILSLLCALLALSSCLSTKRITYFQKAPGEKDTIEVAKEYVPKIQKGDILSIYVNSLSPEASTYFNPYVVTSTGAQSPDVNGGLTQASAPGFLVDNSGNITVPLIGSVAVEGSTTLAVTDELKKRLAIYLKEPTVVVRFLNYKISVIGEVSKPGIYVVPNERITLPEALTLAGDLTPFAITNDVQIIRDNGTKKEFGHVDLTNRNVFASNYYYLHSNDIIYVRAGKAKTTQSDVTFKVVPLIISAATFIILIATKL